MSSINIGKDFSQNIVNRNSLQGDGRYNGEDFRANFLEILNNEDWWKNNEKIILDFDQVDTLGPSWANEVFAFYTKSHSPDKILSKIKLLNISNVKLKIIEREIAAGYRGRK